MADATPKLAKANTGLRTCTGWTILFMVFLRIAIGWHFFYEGVWKIDSGTFSATPYLLASVGPMKDVFRSMINDVDGFKRVGIERDKDGKVVAVKPDFQVAEIKNRCDLIARHYNLTDAQKAVLAQTRDAKINEAMQIYADPDLLYEAVAYVLLLEQVAQEEKNQEPKYLQERMIFNIGKLNGARNKLLTRVEKPAKDIDPVPLFQAAENARLAQGGAQPEPGDWGLALSPKQLDLGPLPLPQAAHFPGRQLAALGLEFKTTTRTELQDLGMMFGLVAIGACLILGLFTRLSAFAAAVFLAMFYFSMPPWPGVQEVPPVEGHYLIVNKNLIELIACLMIMTSGVGRWFGLDAFIGAIVDRRRRNKAERAAAQARTAPGSLPFEKAPAREPVRV